jgi:DNA recombination protein RmuC
MSLDTPLFTFTNRAFTVLDLAAAAAVLALLLLLLAVALAWRGLRMRKAERLEADARTIELEMKLAELSGALSSFASQAQGQSAHLQQAIDARLDQVSMRMGHGLQQQSERTSASLGQLNERLAVIDAAQRNIAALSGEMVSLKDILSNKQSRGAFGQGRMEAIIRDGLPAKSYEFQGTLSNGTRPDCLISLPDSVVRLVIDAKFPLEAHGALNAAIEDAARKAAEARLRSDMTKHVKDIAEKYLLPGETHETAIMFVPSESIYAELHERFEDVVQKAYRQRIILASPNVLMLLVQTLQAMARDVAMRDQAHLIRAEVGKMLEDVGRLKDRTLDLKRHFDMANADLERLGVSADRLAKRGAKIESLELEEAGPAVESQRPRLIATS